MATPVKKREIQQKLTRDKDEDCSENEEYEVADEQVQLKQRALTRIQQLGTELQVDFEGRNPQGPDFHGIKTLLQQLFLKAHIDLTGLTELIIYQNYVGSVIKQSDDVDDADDDDDVNDVFGITTVINISNALNVTCIQHLRDLLLQLADEHATDAVNTMIKNILEEGWNEKVLGLLINERFVNIPAKISVPLFENLISEIRRAKNRGMPFKFTHYILICKLYKSENKKVGKESKKKNKNASSEPSILWSNPEEEIFAEEATASFEFSVEEEADSGLSGTWTEKDDKMVPYRRVLLFEASKLESIFEKIRNQFS